jgi:hypothetical protein
MLVILLERVLAYFGRYDGSSHIHGADAEKVMFHTQEKTQLQNSIHSRKEKYYLVSSYTTYRKNPPLLNSLNHMHCTSGGNTSLNDIWWCHSPRMGSRGRSLHLVRRWADWKKWAMLLVPYKKSCLSSGIIWMTLNFELLNYSILPATVGS